MTQRNRELLESKLPTTSVLNVRSNSISEISTEIVVNGEVESKSLATVSCSPPPLLKRAKSSPNLKDSRETVESTHDSFFNNKQRVIYESSLAALLLQNLEPFMGVMQKVSSLIVPDLFRLADSKETLSPTSEKLYAHFLKDSNVKTAFSPELLKVENRAAFIAEVIRILNSKDPKEFFNQVNLRRCYITFFTEKGQAKPSVAAAVTEQWANIVNLPAMVADTQKFRNDAVYFANNTRLERAKFKAKLGGKEKTHIGTFPPEDYETLDASTKSTFIDKLPKHEAGMYLYAMTTVGFFSSTGMHTYDMPVLCGPSGMTAMYLALANQAELNPLEKQLYSFAVSLFNVAIGAHTVDECFIMGSSEFNTYVRGNYESIIPELVKTNPAFAKLWEEIQSLNKEHANILQSSPQVTQANNTAKVK